MSEFKYHVEVIRFKPSGKFYDHVSFGTDSEWMFDIVDEITQQASTGIISNSFDYMITGQWGDSDEDLYSGGDLPNGHPVFIKIASLIDRV